MSLISEAINKDKLKLKKKMPKNKSYDIKGTAEWKEFGQTMSMVSPVTKSHINGIKSY